MMSSTDKLSVPTSIPYNMNKKSYNVTVVFILFKYKQKLLY